MVERGINLSMLTSDEKQSKYNIEIISCADIKFSMISNT